MLKKDEIKKHDKTPKEKCLPYLYLTQKKEREVK